MRLSRFVFLLLTVLCITSGSRAQSAAEVTAMAAAQLRASTAQLREACANLTQRAQPAPPAADATAGPWKAEEQLCDYVADPGALVTSTAWFFGIFGAVLMTVGMLAFAFLGGTMRRLWRAA